jgi:hypothetical protein
MAVRAALARDGSAGVNAAAAVAVSAERRDNFTMASP